MEETMPDILKLLTDKSCTYSHSLAYNKDVNHALANSELIDNPTFSGMTRMEQASFRLKNHNTFTDTEPPSSANTNHQISTRIEFLYTHLREYLQSYMIDLQYTPDIQT